jgi:hypothetical protein
MTISCPKCSQNDTTGENHNLIVGDKQDEILRAARAGTLHGWCRIHDTVPVPPAVQARIAANYEKSVRPA